MIKNTDTGYFHGQMAKYTKVIGRLANSMERVASYFLMVLNKMEFGRMGEY
jgi:hypothetical protein